MTTSQKLDVVYKKLVSSRAFTKEGTQFFEEPFSSNRQVPLSLVYINSGFIPEIAPKDDISVNGIKNLTYIESEPMVSISSNDLVFSTKNSKLIPKSYGTGYGIVLRTRDGEEINDIDFPFIVDWENGTVRFESETPFNVDRKNTPLATYYFYSGPTLSNVNTFTKTGPRGVYGDTGITGPLDNTTLKYKGKTDFVPSTVNYSRYDVITFENDGNSYICINSTNQSPTANPSAWINICPTGDTQILPENVKWVNDASLIRSSNLNVNSDYYYLTLQKAIDSCVEGVWTTIIVNVVSNDAPLGRTITIDGGKKIHILFRKWSNVFTDLPGVAPFEFIVRDSEVTIENARFGGEYVYGTYDLRLKNRITIESVTDPCTVKFIDCRINTNEIIIQSKGSNDATVEFLKCHINSMNIITNSIVRMNACLCFSSITMDASNVNDKGKPHNLIFRNTFFSNRLGDGRLGQTAKDIVVLAQRDDIPSHYFQVFNSVMPSIGIVFVPTTNSLSPDEYKIYADNSIIYASRIDISSYYNSARLSIIGGNNLNFDSLLQDFVIPYVTLTTPDSVTNTTFSKRGTFWNSDIGTNPYEYTEYGNMVSQWNMLSL